jgi:hypothetical protein
LTGSTRHLFVLNSCRVLQDLCEDRVTSKLDGVRWAKDRLLIPSGYRLSTFVGKNGKTQAFQFTDQQILKSQATPGLQHGDVSGTSISLDELGQALD